MARGFDGLEVLADGNPGASCAIEDLLGGKRVEVQLGERLLQREHQLDIEPTVKLWREPGLDAGLGGAQLPRLAGPSHDLFDRQEISLLLPVVSAERAEGAV